MSIFDQDVHSLGPDLRGRELELPGGTVVCIEEADVYSRETNEKGVYKPLLEMNPGEVFVPKVMGHPMILIAAKDGGQLGGCVRLKVISTPEHGTVSGGGRVGRFVGVMEHKACGRVREREGEPLLLEIDGVMEPTRPDPKPPKHPLPERIVSRYMSRLSKLFMELGDTAPEFDPWLEDVRDKHRTESALLGFLGEDGSD